MFEVRPNRPEEGLRIVSIRRAAVIATHEFLSPEDRNEIDLEAEAYLLSAALWGPLICNTFGRGAPRRCLSIRNTGEKALVELSSPSQRRSRPARRKSRL